MAPPTTSTGQILLPLGDGYGESVTWTVATAELGPGTTSYAGQTFAVRDSGNTTIRSFTAVPVVRVSTDSRPVCDPNDYLYGTATDCPNVQDTWAITWDGRTDASAAVPAGDYSLVTVEGTAWPSLTQLDGTTVHTSAVTAITTQPAAPILVGAVGSNPASRTVTLSGRTWGSVAVPTTGSADLTDSSSAVVGHWDLATPVEAQSVTLSGLVAGSYTLTVHLAFTGTAVHDQAFAVSAVATAVTSTSVQRSDTTVFPLRDGYRDSVRFTLASTTSIGSPIPVIGYVRVLSGRAATGFHTVITLPVTSSDGSVVWNGRVGGRTVPGVYTVRAAVVGSSGKTVVSRDIAVTVRLTTITAAGIRLSAGTIFPVKDGYRDTLTVTASGVTSTGVPLPVRGTVTILKGTRTVYSWALTSTSAKVVAWNGRLGSAVVPGTYAVRVILKGGEGATIVRSVAVVVSPKRLVRHVAYSTKSYTPAYARQDCGGYGYNICEAGYTGYIGSTYYSNLTRYYSNGDGDVLWSAHALPLHSGTVAYQLKTTASTYGARFVIGRCLTNAADPYDCPSGDGASFPLYSDGVFSMAWSSTGVSDRWADFFVGTDEWGSIYVASFTLTSKYVYTVLQ